MHPEWRWTSRVATLVLILSQLSPTVAEAIQIDRNVRDRVVPAAVEVAAKTRWSENDFSLVLPLSIGSGTIISPDGLVLTNHHVIETSQIEDLLIGWNEELDTEMPGVTVELESTDFFIMVSDGISPPVERYTARVVSSDEQLDLAVLRIIGDAGGAADAVAGEVFPFVPIGDSNAMGLGDRVHVFSYPAIGGDVLTYTDGAVSGFQFEEGIAGAAWITTDAVLSGGSSGGTAINDTGELIGVPTQGSELDCRPGDTNRDGVIDVNDIGCIPTGGSLGQLRPINLARKLIEQAVALDVSASPTADEATVTEEATAVVTPPTDVMPTPTPRPHRLRGKETPIPAETPALVETPVQAETPTLVETPVSEETPAPAETTVPATDFVLDLPTLALTPDDLAAVGMPGFVVDWGQMTDLAGLPFLLGIDASWSDAISRTGLQQAYYLRNAESSPDGAAARSVSTTILAYPDSEAATSGFDLFERQIEETLVITDEPTNFTGGDALELTTWTFTDTTSSEEMLAVELSVQSGALVGVVRLVAPIATRNAAIADAESLGAVLLSRLEQSNGVSSEGEAPLSARVLRVEDNGLGGGGDYYLFRDDVVLPLYWYSPPEVAAQWGDYWRLLGVNAAYETDTYLPADYTMVGPRARVNVRLYDFEDEAGAEGFVDAFADDITSSGVTDVAEVTDAPDFAEGSRTYTYQTDWWSDIDPEYRIATAMRQGQTVAIVELAAAEPVPMDVFTEVAAEQEACLAQGCANLTAPAPAWMQETHGSIAAGAATSTPVTSSVATLVAPPLAEPTAVVEPTSVLLMPTPEATEETFLWGFDDTFDASDEPLGGTDFSVFSVADGQMTLTILEPGGLDGFTYDAMPTEGRDFQLLADLVTTTGWGEITLRLGSEDGTTEWFFAIDPVTTQWSLYRTSESTDELFYWVEPRNYAALAPGALRSLAIEMRDGVPVLFINDVDVVSPLGIAMPEMPGSLIAGFGAGINPYSLSGSGDTFTVVIDRITMSELTN